MGAHNSVRPQKNINPNCRGLSVDGSMFSVQRFNCCHSARRLLASIRRVNIAVTSWADAKGLFNMTLFVTPFEGPAAGVLNIHIDHRDIRSEFPRPVRYLPTINTAAEIDVCYEHSKSRGIRP